LQNIFQGRRISFCDLSSPEAVPSIPLAGLLFFTTPDGLTAVKARFDPLLALNPGFVDTIGMQLPPHEFVKLPTLAETLSMLRSAAGEIKLIGGGTDVVFNMRGRLFRPDHLVSLKDLPELRCVEALDDGGVRIGAGCRLSELERDPLVQRYPGLVAGIRAVASRHIRNIATLGGNLCLDTRCWYTNQTAEWREAKGPCLKTGRDYCHAIKTSKICVALNASDTAPALIALDADVTLASADGQRTVPLADFYTDDGIANSVRQADEILVAITVPPPRGTMVYIKETARKGNDFAYGTIAALVADSGHVHLVIGSLTTRPVSLSEPERIVAQQGLTDLSINAAVAATRDELGALTNLYTPAAFKSALGRNLVRRALQQLREETT
jgi:4-hydroxybenzoyl-CoA reductase subunit beta